MKYLVLTCSLMAALSVAAQENTTIETIGDKVLYRGYANKVTVNSDKKGAEIRLTGTNVKIQKTSEPSEYVVKTGNGSIATLHVLAAKGADVDTLKSISYEVKVLPVPSVYWGDAKSGEAADLSSRKLSIKYDEGVPFPNDFGIVSWEISSNDQQARGTGDDISSVEKILEGLDDGTVLNFHLLVMGQDGIKRKVVAQWTI
jgi:hypothetical protein